MLIALNHFSISTSLLSSSRGLLEFHNPKKPNLERLSSKKYIRQDASYEASSYKTIKATKTQTLSNQINTGQILNKHSSTTTHTIIGHYIEHQFNTFSQ
ncbi:hypothetical protein L1887_26022 [Cichorium endivia]|nr:hypothetical protein L1887_26022 [Cichorium endivia]